MPLPPPSLRRCPSSEAMCERHWKQLMQVTMKSFEKGPSFCLDDVLQLNLHEHVDAVSDIVETANKELKIEQKLRKIEGAWDSLRLEFVPYGDGEVSTLAAPDEVLDTLDDHQLQLQTMAGMGRCEACTPGRARAGPALLPLPPPPPLSCAPTSLPGLWTSSAAAWCRGRARCPPWRRCSSSGFPCSGCGRRWRPSFSPARTFGLSCRRTRNGSRPWTRSSRTSWARRWTRPVWWRRARKRGGRRCCATCTGAWRSASGA